MRWMQSVKNCQELWVISCLVMNWDIEFPVFIKLIESISLIEDKEERRRYRHILPSVEKFSKTCADEHFA